MKERNGPLEGHHMGRLIELAERIEQGWRSPRDQAAAAVAYLRETVARLLAAAGTRVAGENGASRPKAEGKRLHRPTPD